MSSHEISVNVDFCCGEEIYSSQSKHDELMGVGDGGNDLRNVGDLELGSGNSIVDERDTTQMLSNQTTLLDHYRTLSQTSRFILFSSLFLFLVISILMLIGGHGERVFLLILILAQPLIILYYLYWKQEGWKAHVTLDLVLKLFSIGFWWSTGVAMIVEMILQAIIFSTLFAFSGINVDDYKVEDGSDSDGDGDGRLLGMFMNNGYLDISSPSYISSSLPSINFFSFSPSQSSSSSSLFQSYDSNNDSNNDGSDSSSNNQDVDMRSLVKDHLFVAIVGVFCMAFIVAASGECVRVCERV